MRTRATCRAHCTHPIISIHPTIHLSFKSSIHPASIHPYSVQTPMQLPRHSWHCKCYSPKWVMDLCVCWSCPDDCLIAWILHGKSSALVCACLRCCPSRAEVSNVSAELLCRCGMEWAHPADDSHQAQKEHWIIRYSTHKTTLDPPAPTLFRWVSTDQSLVWDGM